MSCNPRRQIFIFQQWQTERQRKKIKKIVISRQNYQNLKKDLQNKVTWWFIFQCVAERGQCKENTF